MIKALCLLIGLTVVLTPCLLFGEDNPIRFSDIQPDLESAISRLSSNINAFFLNRRLSARSARLSCPQSRLCKRSLNF